MTDLEAGLRELIREIVREELATARPSNDDEMLTTSQAAAHAGVVTKTIRRWIDDGKLTEHRAGRELRVRRGDLERLLNGIGEPSPEQLAEEAVARRFGR